MRLTLRTLLMYMDDVLESPAQTREIGRKIKESAVANSLLNQIRQVMRRRRLTAPDVEGPDTGLDPNTVAEYLDFTLPPGAVADVEKVCLQSDVHLAEVAGCHQVLTLVLGEPVEVDARMRERMYALGPTPPGGVGSVGLAREPVGAESAQPAGDPEAFESRIPEYLRSKPLFKRATPYVLLAVALVVWVGLVFYDPSYNVFRSGASDGANVAAVDGQDEGPVDKAGGSDPASHTDDGSGSPANGQQRSPEDTPPEGDRIAAVDQQDDAQLPFADDIDPDPPEDEPPVGEGQPDGVLPPVPEPADEKPEAGNGEAQAKGDVPPVPEPDDPGVAEPARPTLRYSQAEASVLLVPSKAEEDGAWMPASPTGVFRPDDEFACPDPFRLKLRTENSPLQIDVLGHSRVRYLGGTPPVDAALRVRAGRLVLTRTAQAKPQPDGGAENGPRVMLELGTHAFGLELAEPGSVVGLEVGPRLPEGVQPPRHQYHGTLFVKEGRARVAHVASGRAVELKGGQSLLLDADHWLGEDDGGGPYAVDVPAPVWVGDEELAPSRQTRNLFLKQFLPDAPAGTSLEPVVDDANANVALLATRCMALVGNERALVRALAVSPHEDVYQEAIVGLQAALVRNPDSAEAIKDLLRIRFGEDVSQIVFRLLQGYGRADARDQRTSEQLVAYLDPTQPNVVRRVAFFHVRRLSGLELDYRPDSRARANDRAYRRWIDYVMDHGGLLPQE